MVQHMLHQIMAQQSNTDLGPSLSTVHIWTKGEVGAPLNRFKPFSKIFYWPFQGRTSFVDLLCFFCLVFDTPCTRLFICALWSPAGKGLTSWLSFVVSNCEFVTFPLVSWVRCGTLLYRFLIFASLQCTYLSRSQLIATWYSKMVDMAII